MLHPPPLPPLVIPKWVPHHTPEISLTQRLPPRRMPERQHLLLDVRRQEKQAHDLAHPRPGETESPSSVGMVTKLTASDALIDDMRER